MYGLLYEWNLDIPLSLKGIYKQHKIQMSHDNGVSYWDLYFSVSSSTLVHEDTARILGEFVDQTNRERVTDTRIGRIFVQSETDNLKPTENSQIPVRKRDLPFRYKNLTH